MFTRSIRFAHLVPTTAALLGSASILVAGPLAPPAGAVTSTMKTLAEVEPRTAINVTNTPGNATNMFVISQPGSYYLTADLIVTAGKSGILVQTSNVTIDLNGYAIRGGTGSVSGIVGTGVSRVSIRNGSISASGLSTGSGISLTPPNTFPQGIILQDLVISQFTVDGIEIGSGSITNCIVERCGSDGASLTSISAESTISRCVFNNNSGFGMNMYNGTVTETSASNNTSTGISVSTGTVLGCTATGNSTGISIEAGVVSNCSAQNNTSIGIRTNGNGLIKGNCVSADALALNTIGIRVQNTSGARLEGNVITRMSTGISCGTANNLIIANAFRGCTNAVSLVANNRLAPLVSATSSPAITGNSGGGLGTTDPTANLIY